MKKYIVLFLVVSTVGFSQNLNGYKYAIVPSKFSFLKEENMYNLNVLTKMFMQKYGFETYLSNETAPDDFVNTNCNKIFVDVVPSNGIFTTKIKVIIKDCKGTILCSSDEGSSRDKEYRIAYNEALRMAFDSFSVLKTHQYQPSEKSSGMIGEPAPPVKIDNGMLRNIDESIKINPDEKKVPHKVEPFDQGYKLYSQNTGRKFLVMTLYKTSIPDCYLFYEKVANGIVTKKGEQYFAEYYIEGKLHSDEIFIEKF